MASEDGKPASQGHEMALAEIGLAVLLTLSAAGLSFFMPDLIAIGGIPAAHDVTTLSPIFFPRMAFGLLGILCFTYFVRTVRQLAAARPGPDRDMQDRLLRAGLMIVIAAAYSYLVTELGYGASTLLMTAVVSFYLGLRQWWVILTVSVLVPVVIRFIFERLLLISLPRGNIEFIAGIEDGIMKFLVSILLGR